MRLKKIINLGGLFLKIKPYTEVVGVLKEIKNDSDSVKIVFLITEEIEVSKELINFGKLVHLKCSKEPIDQIGIRDFNEAATNKKIFLQCEQGENQTYLLDKKDK